MKNDGTPKTFREAIKNGIEQYKNSDVQNIVRDEHGDILTAFIATHAKDFLAQRFGVSFMSEAVRVESVMAKELWARIFGDDAK